MVANIEEEKEEEVSNQNTKNLTIHNTEWKIHNIPLPRKRVVFPSSHVFPVCCFFCSNRRISQHFLEYEYRISLGEPEHDILNSLKFNRECCRTMFIGHIDQPTTRLTNGHIY